VNSTLVLVTLIERSKYPGPHLIQSCEDSAAVSIRRPQAHVGIFPRAHRHIVMGPERLKEVWGCIPLHAQMMEQASQPQGLGYSESSKFGTPQWALERVLVLSGRFTFKPRWRRAAHACHCQCVLPSPYSRQCCWHLACPETSLSNQVRIPTAFLEERFLFGHHGGNCHHSPAPPPYY